MSPRIKLSLALAAGFVAGLGVGLAGGPVKRAVLAGLFQSDYGDQLYVCDSAMRAHLHAKFVIEDAPSEQAVENLKAAEISLLACQDYDLFQKRLLRYGLKEEDLSYMRLKAVEERGEDLQAVVREHEFRY